MRYSLLSDWLAWQETLHSDTIELGLDRVNQVFKRLHPQPAPCPVITVAGTNGKGSSVALLESIYQHAGYVTAAFTSPHLLHYNERIHLNGQKVSDMQLCEAFERIDLARLQDNNEISLTYFEFGTLAALDLYFRHKPDVMILEVGLGGRLDAVNIIDADVALITSISIDHTAWLGFDRESIAKEKAGIMRRDRPAIFSGSDIPQSIIDEANEKKAKLLIAGQNFSWRPGLSEVVWDWASGSRQRNALPKPSMRGDHQLDNAAGVLMVIEALSDKLAVNQQQIKMGLLSVSIVGRFQCIAGKPLHILDVAHNPGSMRCLSDSLRHQPCTGKSIAVLGMLQDKEHAIALQPLMSCFGSWFVSDLNVARGCQASQLADVLFKLNENANVSCFETVEQALKAADEEARAEDRIVIFGSFYIVEFALRLGI